MKVHSSLLGSSSSKSKKACSICSRSRFRGHFLGAGAAAAPTQGPLGPLWVGEEADEVALMVSSGMGLEVTRRWRGADGEGLGVAGELMESVAHLKVQA